MSRTPRSIERIPGVLGPDSCAPEAVFDARRAIRRARRRANLSDALDFSVLIGVNLLMAFWEQARIPFLSRDTSVLIVLLANVFHVFDWVMKRHLPLWRARFIASSWSREERARLEL